MDLDRDIILARLHQDLVGPDTAQEVLTSLPSDVYLTGILWPRETLMGQEEDDRLGTEGAGSREQDAGGGEEEEVAVYSTRRPSTAGLSLASVASPENGRGFEAMGRVYDAEGTAFGAMSTGLTDAASRDVRAAGQRAENLKRVGDGYAEDVHDADKSMDKALDFLKEWRGARDAATSAALYRA